MHTAPNPGPEVGKAHDISFEREKTLMRLIHNQGNGTEVREGSFATVHFTVSQPGPDGQLVEMFNSEDKWGRDGLRFENGRTFHSEALDRGVKDCQPGAVIDVFATDPEAGGDPVLRLFPTKMSEEALTAGWGKPGGPIGQMQGAVDPPPMMEPKEEDKEPPWAPPRYLTVWHIRLDSTTDGCVPMYMDAYERLDWCRSRKAFATELFQAGHPARAARRYKKTMLDLEVPCQWELEKHNVERNVLRSQLHLNVAACGLKLPTEKSYPNLSCPKRHWDPQLDAISHCTRVLRVDPKNVKALYRRAQAHMLLPEVRHINGLQEALADLKQALELEPQNSEVRKELARAKGLQKDADRKAAGMYTKMVGTGELL